MKRILHPLLAVALVAAISACANEVDSGQIQEGLHEVVFHAGWDTETKTVLQEDLSVWWSPGDEISLFTYDGQSGGGYKLTSNNAEPAPRVDFIGEIDNKADNFSYIAIYPYDPSSWVSGSLVRTSIPSIQVAREETFGDNMLVSIARSDNETLYFRNICSGIQFSVCTPGIKKIVITAKNGVPLSGEVFINVENDQVSSGSIGSVTITAPDESGFETGKNYYAVITPTLISSGIDIKYYTDDKVGYYTNSNPVEFKKGVFKRLREKDRDIPFVPYTENSTRLYSYWLLPEGIDKTIIENVSFEVNSDKITDTSIVTDSSVPIFFELDGTTAKYFTKAEKYSLMDAKSMFYGWTALKKLDLTNIETAFVTDMGNMFADCISLQSIKFGDFCTANVNNTSGMFSNCWSLESLDLSGFKTSRVQYMSFMFAGCSSLNTLDLSSFDTSNVEDMSGMFGACFPQSVPYYQGNALVGCCSLESLDLHSFNTGKVQYMNGMFTNASNLKFINLSEWNTSNVENIGAMFMGCVSLERVDLSSFDTQKVTWMGHVFDGCSNLKSLDLSNFNTAQVTSMQSMFAFCESLQSLDISSFDASNLTDAMELVRDAVHMKHLDLGAFDLSNVSIIDASFAALSFKRKAVAIRCIDATKQIIENLADGYYFNIDNVTWVGIDESFPDLPDVDDPSLYCSVDFTMDKKVKILQPASQGKGIDIVIMGDAYSDRLIADGTYEIDMREAIDAIFEMEPMKSYKDFFNVYMVYAVSKNEVHEGATALGVYNQIGNSDICKAYTRIAISNKPLSDIAIIVIGHDREAFPEPIANVLTVYSWKGDEYNDYGQAEYSIAYCGKTGDTQDDANTFVHEFGHLFAKLADEYERNDEAIGSSDEYEIPNLIDFCLHTGAYKNIDLTGDPETIKWYRFLADSRYADEHLGAYEGGLLYSKGVWRPNENSIMRTGTVFNAPSREAIYYRIHKLAYGEDWQYDYETFVQQDLKNIPAEPYYQSSPRYVPYPMRVPRKHLFKMEESIAPDGRKLVTVIMD